MYWNSIDELVLILERDTLVGAFISLPTLYSGIIPDFDICKAIAIPSTHTHIHRVTQKYFTKIYFVCENQDKFLLKLI